ncbi:MAG: rhodanese-like domain-containing protein [Gammaproteobacteria bacterium]|nr:rhodanese-like domain-containing protein [Gammaproteobacteria bacterium]
MLCAIPKKTAISLCSLLASTVFLAEAWAVAPPESIDGTIKVNAEELIALAENIPELVIIDSRIAGDRNQGFIESAFSLPDVDTTCDSLSKIIRKKDTASLFYCNGVKCARSAKAIKIALGCGYSNIYWFRGGFGEWQEKGYPYLQE